MAAKWVEGWHFRGIDPRKWGLKGVVLGLFLRNNRRLGRNNQTCQVYEGSLARPTGLTIQSGWQANLLEKPVRS